MFDLFLRAQKRLMSICCWNVWYTQDVFNVVRWVGHLFDFRYPCNSNEVYNLQINSVAIAINAQHIHNAYCPVHVCFAINMYVYVISLLRVNVQLFFWNINIKYIIIISPKQHVPMCFIPFYITVSCELFSIFNLFKNKMPNFGPLQLILRNVWKLLPEFLFPLSCTFCW